MAHMHTVYQLTITTLSPLHIGTGSRLRRDYDYVTHNGKTWVIDDSVLAEMLYDQDPSEFERMAGGSPAGELIEPHEFVPESPLFRYVMHGEPRSRARGSEIQEQIKDPWDHPYIPGSSLKGALRTALTVVGFQRRKLSVDTRRLGSNYRYAAQPLEKEVLSGMRGTPNDDLLRALQVGDSAPAEKTALQLLNVQVTTGKRSASPIELEAVRRGTEFTATLTLDGFLRDGAVARELGWQDDQLMWLDNIPAVVNHVTKRRLADEFERWQNSDEPAVRSFYTDLVKRITAGNLAKRGEFYLQLGWGGGWDSKTFGPMLTDDEQAFSRVVAKFERRLIRQGKYQVGDRFPKTRRIAVRHDKAARRDMLWMPLGWIHVKMERMQ